MRIPTVAVAAALLVTPAASFAQLEVGARLGYASAAGDAMKNQKLSDLVKSQIPVQLDVGYRLTPELSAGAYVSYGFAKLASAACPSGFECSARDLRVGVQGTYTLTRLATAFVPWVALGAGWERATYEVSQTVLFFTAKGTGKVSGWEYLNVQLGADWRASEKLWLGPYAMWSLGQFSTAKIEIPGGVTLPPELQAGVANGTIPDQRMHQWWGLGVRGKLAL